MQFVNGKTKKINHELKHPERAWASHGNPNVYVKWDGVDELEFLGTCRVCTASFLSTRVCPETYTDLIDRLL
tara:strand:+ start:217 stop:432 length:216 start_codon:yes stop_codon:yes gene_type:complete